MIPLDKAKQAYYNDPVFHHMVDTMIGFIMNLELSPSEIRQAAMFACYLVEERKPRYIGVDLARYEKLMKGE